MQKKSEITKIIRHDYDDDNDDSKIIKIFNDN